MMKNRNLTYSQLFFAIWILSCAMLVVMGLYAGPTVMCCKIWKHNKLATIYSEWQMVAAYPWLISNHSSKALFLTLYNDLDRLLMFMSNKTGKIALVRFSYPWQIMVQNEIYTLVKFGHVYNYIVMVGDEKSLQVCLELNLPCYNGTKYYKNYYRDADPTVDASYLDKKHYRPINWFKLRFYRDILIRNYTILALDTDIAFSRKDIWLSFEKYSEDVGNCDMIFMQEEPINAGFFYSRSNPSTITLLNKWIDTERTHWDLDEQQSFIALRGYYYGICNTTEQCNAIKQRRMINIQNNLTDSAEIPTVTLRTFPAAYAFYGTGVCPTNRKVHPCLPTTVLLHTICLIGQTSKIDMLKMNGFWLLKEHCDRQLINSTIESNTTVTLDIRRCKPLIFKYPDAERRFQSCRNVIAWTTQTQITDRNFSAQG